MWGLLLLLVLATKGAPPQRSTLADEASIIAFARAYAGDDKPKPTPRPTVFVRPTAFPTDIPPTRAPTARPTRKATRYPSSFPTRVLPPAPRVPASNRPFVLGLNAASMHALNRQAKRQYEWAKREEQLKELEELQEKVVKQAKKVSESMSEHEAHRTDSFLAEQIDSYWKTIGPAVLTPTGKPTVKPTATPTPGVGEEGIEELRLREQKLRGEAAKKRLEIEKAREQLENTRKRLELQAKLASELATKKRETKMEERADAQRKARDAILAGRAAARRKKPAPWEADLDGHAARRKAAPMWGTKQVIGGDDPKGAVSLNLRGFENARRIGGKASQLTFAGKSGKKSWWWRKWHTQAAFKATSKDAAFQDSYEFRPV